MELNKGRCIKVKKGDALAQFNLSPEERAQVFPDHKENFELLELTEADQTVCNIIKGDYTP
ncbi:MAG: hypothetical protein ACR2PX_12970 [Endozoicomonas sp.]|uniref:hypothetical protein n=1 Tax=Endozoicomonas sp. TaxID=1892382 RepID=UPI003D9BB2DB